MDQDIARRLFIEGATLVLLDVPEKTEFGMDYNSWTVGPKFKGVKMIPPGFHFVFYSAVNRQGQPAPRTGFFHFFERQEVIVKRWDPKIEDLTDEGITPEIVGRIKGNLRDFDPFLGAYPYESLSKWVSLTNHISEDLVSKLQPISGKVSSVTQVCPAVSLQHDVTTVSESSNDQMAGIPPVEGEEDGIVTKLVIDSGKGEDDTESCEGTKEECTAELKGDSSVTPGGIFAGVGEFFPTRKQKAKPTPPQLRDLDMSYVKEAALRLSMIPRQKHPDGATPAQISHHNMDLSFSLETMLSKEYSNDEKSLLGELQFCFVCFLVGHVYDAFEHWKELVKLSCLSEEALITHKDYFKSFITVLHFQLKEIPEDFFVDIVSRNNFLTGTLQSFFSNLEESSGRIDNSLVKRGLQFRNNLTRKYKWDFSSEPDDFAPTVVDIDSGLDRY